MIVKLVNCIIDLEHLGTGGSSDKGLADSSVLEDSWGLDLVPLLLGEGIDDLLLVTLSALGQSLVLTNRHVGLMGPLDLKKHLFERPLPRMEFNGIKRRGKQIQDCWLEFSSDLMHLCSSS